MRGLGRNQRGVLRCLREHGFYQRGVSGWYWDTDYGTGRILNSLVNRGLVENREGRYTLSDKGMAATDGQDKEVPQ